MLRNGFINNDKQKTINNYILFFCLLLISLITSYALANGNKIIAFGALGLFCGIYVILNALNFLKFGLSIVLILSLSVNGLKRLTETGFPLGTLVDLTCSLLLLVVLIGTKFNKQKIVIDSFGSILLFYAFYNILQVFNPKANSILSWFHHIRVIFTITSVYFITVGIIKSIKDVEFFLRLIIILNLILAFYGIYQELYGFLPYETKWIYSTNQYSLLYTFGKWRKFSFLSGPMIFGILMAIIGVLCLILSFGEKSKRFKIFYIFSGTVMLWAMFYTSTRTAYVLLPAGILFFAILTLKKNILIICGILLVALTFVIVAPTNNPNLYIFKTAFKPKDDASFLVRKHNQAFIRPYIQSNPFGLGLGSVGFSAAVYAPNSLLSSFPPDSEMVKVAIDLGWLGLFFYCMVWFTLLKHGIENYFSVKDSKIKNYYSAFTCVILLYLTSNYPQEAVQMESMVIISIIAGIMTKLKYLDNQNKETL